LLSILLIIVARLPIVKEKKPTPKNIQSKVIDLSVIVTIEVSPYPTVVKVCRAQLHATRYYLVWEAPITPF
jgi:hypothetical protein